MAIIDIFLRFDYNDSLARRPVLMIFSWTTHQPICKDNLARPLCIPGATSVLIAEPHPFKLSLRWYRDGATSGQWPTVQDLLSKCLGQTVDEVQYGDAVVLRSRVKISHD